MRTAIGRRFTDYATVKGSYKGTAKKIFEAGVSVSNEDGQAIKDLNVILKQVVSSYLNEGAGEDNCNRIYADGATTAVVKISIYLLLHYVGY